MPPKFDVKTMEQLLDEYALERLSDTHKPVRLGFGALDADIRGISLGQVCGVAARTGVGKTWVLNTVAHNIAARTDIGTLILSLEMPGVEWAERQLAVSADVRPDQVESWARTGELGAKAAEFVKRMENTRLVDQSMRLADLPVAFAQTREQLGDVPLRVVLVDYLGLLDHPGRDAYERASATGKGLKQIAKQEKVAIIVAMQVSRAGGDGSEPVSIDMMRDSGVLEEALDFLLGAWRPGKATNLSLPDADRLRNVMRVRLLKNRKGEDGRTVDLLFRPESRKLYEEADPFTAAGV